MPTVCDAGESDFFKKYSPKCNNIFGVLTEDIALKIRESFVGGRNEIFSNPDNEEVYHYDFKSFYGTIMQDSKFPIGKPDLVLNPESILTPGFYYADVYSNIDIPALPYFNNNKLLFPNGTIWYAVV